MNFRKAVLEDLPELKELYAETIRSVCKHDYTEKQTAIWSSSVHKEERWLDMMVNQFVLIAEIDTVIVGFGTLKGYCYIDFFYVHKEFQGQGIARELLRLLLQKAMVQGQKLVTSDISMTARPFFEKNGFKVVAEQENIRQDEILINYKMIRHLPGPGINPGLQAVFNITDAFKITGRGLIFAGSKVEGDIFAGDSIEFMAGNQLKRRRIRGVQMFSGSNIDHSKIGLLIACESEQEIDEFRAMAIFNLIACVYSPES